MAHPSIYCFMSNFTLKNRNIVNPQKKEPRSSEGLLYKFYEFKCSHYDQDYKSKSLSNLYNCSQTNVIIAPTAPPKHI